MSTPLVVLPRSLSPLRVIRASALAFRALRSCLVFVAAFALFSCNHDKKEGETAGSTAENLLLDENFESGMWPSAIQRTGECATVTSSAANASSFGVELREACTIQNSLEISTLGYTGIQIHYDYRTLEYDPGETLTIEWSKDGKTWLQVAVHGSTPAWTTVNTPLPAAAEGLTTLYVRLKSNANGNSGVETADIDNLRVTGVAPAGCDFAQLCSLAIASCGVMEDSLCGSFSCGACGAGKKCEEQQCIVDCSPAAQCGSRTCGEVTVAGCGPISCGSCGSQLTCVEGACLDHCAPAAVCKAREQADSGPSCGVVDGGACGQVDCGVCATGTCENNFCPCVPQTCSDQAAVCGHPDDGCGGVLDCGDCSGLTAICDGQFQCKPDTCTDCGPLTGPDLGVLEQYLDCSTRCSYGKAALFDECLVACPAKQQRWDKNRDGKVDDIDRQLAMLEILDGGSGASICYEDGAVVPAKACRNCTATHDAAFCQAKEGNGFKTCDADNPCPSFDQECRYIPDANRKLCAARDCASTSAGCTAFHLEEIAQDNDEVVVRVHYDYSPVPATVLDLYLSYEGDKLLLGDARPLAALTNRGKELQSRQMGPDRLRLTVLGAESSAPIGTGPIIELVFIRTSAAQSTLSFSVSPSDRTWSLAPNQGKAKEELTKDSLWGGLTDPQRARVLNVHGADPNGNRLLLHYSFDNAQKPLDVAKVETGESLCDLQLSSGSCPALNSQGQAPPERIKAVARYGALQRGVVQADDAVKGVSGNGVFLDGISDHLELPVTLNQPLASNNQNFTASFWFYAEGDQGATRQVLWSHNHPLSENALFAVTLAPKADDTFDLEWMSGTLTGAATKVIKSGLPNHKWAHLAIAYDASALKALFYLDGAPVMVNGTTAPPEVTAPVLQCPQFSPNFKIGEEGAGTGTKTPQLIYFASEESGLFGLERMDTTGMAQKRLLREPDSQAADVDYSPILDKIVFASSKSGSYEIWIANGDGSNARQVTFGFGDAARGISARRPRFAPDASAVVFESNVFSIPNGDNTEARGSRLFYLAYDSSSNEFAIPFGDGQKLTTLEYATIVPKVSPEGEARILDRYRLTATGINASNVFWANSGELWYTVTDALGDNPRISKLLVDKVQASNSSAGLAQPFPDPETDVRLLAAAVDSTGADASPEPVKLLERKWVSYDPATGYTVTFTTPVLGTLRAKVTYSPPTQSAKCWDNNVNNICDLADEDTNADNSCTVADCLAKKVDNLFLLYPTPFVPQKTALGTIADQTSPVALDSKKAVRLTDVTTSTANYVRIEVRSDIDRAPIPSGTTLATIDFTGTGSSAGFLLKSRTVNQQLYVNHPGKDLSQQLTPFVQTGLEEVLSAAFSPNAERLVLSAIERARPVIVTTPDLVGTVSGELKMRKISDAPVAVEGLQWVAVERSLPCNWFGAYRNPGTKIYTNAFRGGIDELKLHSYVRSPGVIQSEAERGLERLAKNQPGGPPSKAISCLNSLECPAYQVCGAGGKCEVKVCDPNDAYSCGGKGKCVLASAVEMPGGTSSEFVCAAECAGSGEVANSACFSQQCRNGPCRFCDSTSSACVECRENTSTDALGVTTTNIEGCPDRNSYACKAGSCVTECYSFTNDQSKYLCDPATEYCKQGRCATFDWSWTDMAPATFSGLSEMHVAGFTPTVAIPQMYPVKISAYGVEDYGHSPQILVQGRVKDAPGFLGQWFDVGKITVYNRTATEAEQKPYTLLTSYPITDLRVKLVTQPIDNQNSANTGLAHLARDQAFCGSGRACDRRAPGSLPTLGYQVGIPQYEVEFATKCRAAGGLSTAAACDYAAMIGARSPYLMGGRHAVIVTDAMVQGTSITTSKKNHKACSYAGTSQPRAGDGTARMMWFGNPASETSNQKVAFYPSATSSTELLNLFATPLPGGELLLNCGFSLPDPTGTGFPGNIAGVEFNDFIVPYQTHQSGGITENANGCTVQGSGPIPERCFETVGDARIDFMTQDQQIFKTLELQDFTSFGYATNSP